jgi:signal transduction histidine kinase
MQETEKTILQDGSAVSNSRAHGQDRAAVWRSKKRGVRTIRMAIMPLRAESQPEGASAVEWLSTSIVHDLRNPLATIYAAAETLVDLHSAPIQVKRLAANIYDAADRMRKLLADLNGDLGGHPSRAEICNIRDIIAAACEAVSGTKDDHRVQIQIQIPDCIELPLKRSRMERVFFNLIANALEAMPAGGKLRILGRKAGNWALIEVEDTGPGIPLEIRDRLFEPFVTAGKQGGFGLGLALSRQTLLNHGGDIWTEPAAGARFIIRLPLSRAGHPRESS